MHPWTTTGGAGDGVDGGTPDASPAAAEPAPEGLRRRLRAGQRMVLRSVQVFVSLFPFFITLVRDRRRYILLGGQRRVSTTLRKQRARRLRETVSRLGPTFIKLGQILSLRADILPPEYIAELSQLQDQVPPVAVAAVAAVIEAELQRPLGLIFAEFNRQPEAAASLGQVHRAVLADGRAVAVKVLRPGVEAMVLQDTVILLQLGEALVRYTRWGLSTSLLNVFTEFSAMIRKEMDFRLEGTNAEEFRRSFAGYSYIRIPLVHWGLTTQRVLVTEFIEGVKIDQVAGIYAMGLEPATILENLTRSYLHQTLTFGLLHADPHPGNILVTPLGELAFLDFGMVVQFTPELRRQLIDISIAGVARDMDMLMASLDDLGVIDPDANVPVLRDAIALLIDHLDRMKISQGRFEHVANAIFDTVYRFPVQLPSNLVYLFKAAIMVEGIGTLYIPGFSGIAYATPIVKDMLRDELLSTRKGIGQRVVDKAWDVYRLSKMAERVITRADREQFRIRSHPKDIQLNQRYATNLVRRLLLGLFSLGIAIDTAVLFQVYPHLLVLAIGWALSFLMLLVALLLPYTWGGGEQRQFRRRQ